MDRRVTTKGYTTIYNRYVKRVFDVIAAVVLLIALFPLYFVIAFAVIVDTGFPVFYRPLRGGYRNKPFHIIKFRTMIKDADKGSGTTALNDSRITRVGRFLRKTKLDEISQLFNVIAGTMSFIGPRPELLKYTEQYAGEEKLILEVRPGITDFSSIEFINLDEIVGEENPEEMYEKYVLKKKNELRIKYAKEVSLKTDVYLFCKTVWYVLKKAFRVICHK
ncbi:MAG: sugar transferase [Clostridia bacterium]|nr:sugar transferase [Clostridia bacterium]